MTKNNMGKTFKDGEFSSAAKKLGQRGGQKTAKKYGKKHFQNLAKQRWAEKEEA